MDPWPVSSSAFPNVHLATKDTNTIQKVKQPTHLFFVSLLVMGCWRAWKERNLLTFVSAVVVVFSLGYFLHGWLGWLLQHKGFTGDWAWFFFCVLQNVVGTYFSHKQTKPSGSDHCMQGENMWLRCFLSEMDSNFFQQGANWQVDPLKTLLSCTIPKAKQPTCLSLKSHEQKLLVIHSTLHSNFSSGGLTTFSVQNRKQKTESRKQDE